MNSRRSYLLILFTIALLGLLLRLYHLNWDQGFHLHPDERAIVLYTLPLALPTTITAFFSSHSPWNPHFFAYGSFPLYLLWGTGHIMGFVDNRFASYDLINLIGRTFSALFDVGTILCVYVMGKKLFSPHAGLCGAFLYAISVLPIQLSHFYAVDTLLTFLLSAILVVLLFMYEKPTYKKSILLGILIGLAFATKISALPILLPVGFVLISDFLLIFITAPHKPSVWFPHVPMLTKQLLVDAGGIILIAVGTFAIAEPYAIIDKLAFWNQTQLQSLMTKDAWVFPYTLQYVGKIRYVYEIKQVFLWGMGPLIALMCFTGVGVLVYQLYKKEKKEKWAQELILFIFVLPYFLVVGHFAVGFMRYMLPLYPFLCICGGIVLSLLSQRLHSRLQKSLGVLVLVILLIWPISFMHIYSQDTTRVRATMWIRSVITPGSTIATEHWDDQLPLGGTAGYSMETLSLYDPDSPIKWQKINTQLAHSDYLIVASNRLYVPLMKLTNCQQTTPHPCYKQTANYYRQLFAGTLGYKKVAEFATYPTIPLLNIPINDQSADESFTVYDHPKIMIFKKQ